MESGSSLFADAVLLRLRWRGICISHHLVAAVIELQSAFYRQVAGYAVQYIGAEFETQGRSTVDPTLHIAGTYGRHRAAQLFGGCGRTAGQVPVVDGWRQDQLEEQPAAAWAGREGINGIVMKPVDTGNVRSFADLVGRCFRDAPSESLILPGCRTLTGGWVAGQWCRTCRWVAGLWRSGFRSPREQRRHRRPIHARSLWNPYFGGLAGVLRGLPKGLRVVMRHPRSDVRPDFPAAFRTSQLSSNPGSDCAFSDVFFIATAGVPVDPISDGASPGNRTAWLSSSERSGWLTTGWLMVMVRWFKG